MDNFTSSQVPRSANSSEIVSGRSKPASDGRLKTGHFEKGEWHRRNSSTHFLLMETDGDESTQDGEYSGDITTTFDRIVTA
jgi:hypothetical protein